jgi:hypothetical protein
MKACAYANEVGNGIFTNKIEGQSNNEESTQDALDEAIKQLEELNDILKD